jgi:hypothetical protein
MILEAVNAACLWAADVHGWQTTAPFEEARDRLLAFRC